MNISGKADWLKAKPLQGLFKALNRRLFPWAVL